MLRLDAVDSGYDSSQVLFGLALDAPARQVTSLIGRNGMGKSTTVRTVMGLLATRGGRIGWNDAAFGALVAAFPNSGFMGVPLILALLGEAAVGPVMATLLVDLVVTTSVCIGLSQWGAADEHGAAKAAGRALQGVLRNPMPWSILLGALTGALGLAPWAPLARTVDLLADAASPVALFTIGAVLARSQVQAQTRAQSGAAGLGDVGVITLVKLLVHPLLVWALGWLAVRAGGLTPATVTSLVLTAALPAAGNVSLLAERFGADNGRVARIILWSTALAFFSFSGVVALRP